jgi:transcriptional regulator with XRE-family HTH domain
MKEQFLQQFVDILKSETQAQGISFNKLCKDAGISRSRQLQLFSGKGTNPTLSVMLRFLDVVGYTLKIEKK